MATLTSAPLLGHAPPGPAADPLAVAGDPQAPRSILLGDARVFKPTLTTWMLVDCVLADKVRGNRVLDLGCGSGPIAISLAKAGASRVHAVDVMAEACELARRNVKLNGVEERVTVLCGSLFAPVRDLTFDVIVDDVSGVASEVARLSSWFPSGVPLGGEDGTELTIAMLREAPARLAPGGRLYFPVLSLSASARTVAAASRQFGNRLAKIASRLIPFNDELKANLPALADLQAQGRIGFEQVRSRLFWRLDIYRATAP